MLKSIPIAKYFEIQNQEYVYLKLIPSKSIRNNRTYSILELVNKMYINLNKLIKIEDNKLIIRTQLKASYYIHITKEKINFYFIVPKLFYSKFRVKFKEIWKSVEIKEAKKLDGIELQVNARNTMAYEMYKKYGFTEKSINMELL